MQAALYSLTAAESAGKVMGDSLMTALIGVVVVFATLVVLTLIFILFGKVMHRPKKEAPAVPAPKPKPAAAPKRWWRSSRRRWLPWRPRGNGTPYARFPASGRAARFGRRPAWRRAPARSDGRLRGLHSE